MTLNKFLACHLTSTFFKFSLKKYAYSSLVSNCKILSPIILTASLFFNTLSAKDELSRPSFYTSYAKDEITRPSGKFKFEDFSAM